jgi:hypothetical protein
MTRSRRGMVIWLVLLGIAVALIALGSIFDPTAVNAQVATILLAAYAGVAGVALIGDRLRHVKLEMPRINVPIRMSPAARKATQRARGRSDYSLTTTLTDVGMIVNERSRDGQWNRHLAQIVSMDDDAIQPYITLHATPEDGNRVSLVEFTIYDQAGKLRFSRVCEQYVRDGENLIVCDRHLPLEGNENIGRAGVWDLQVRIDGAMAAVHSFSVNPSTTERRRQLSEDGEVATDGLAAPAEFDEPISLDELLREHRRSGSSQR